MWGELVEVTDEAHGCYGRVGQYEGVISAELDALRVRLPECVIVARQDQLCAFSHPVCAIRRLRKRGIRQPRVRHAPAPACYAKDYGKTSAETATDAFWGALGTASGEELSQLAGAMLFHQCAERLRLIHPPRRLTKAIVAKHRDRDAANERRWLRTRKALRAIARERGRVS